jgi:hypothetical protein
VEAGRGVEGGRDTVRGHHRRLSAIPPCSVFLPPSLSASRAEASRAAMVGAEAVRPAGARDGSEVLGTAKALQHWRPGRVDEGA